MKEYILIRIMRIVYEKNMRNLVRNLHKAINDKNLNDVKECIKTGFHLDNFYNGKVASQVALQNGCYEICSLLLKSGSDINLHIEEGNTLLHLSLRHPIDIDRICFLLENCADPDAANYLDETPLQIACHKGDVVVAKLLIRKSNFINRCDLKGETALFKCTLEGHVEIVKLLIENEADLEWTDNERQTPLMRAIEGNRFNAVQLLVEAGCNVNAKDKYHKTPLMLACKLNLMPIIKCLLNHKATIDLCDLKKTTAFTEAVFSLNLQVIDELIGHGCNVNLASFDLQQTALHHCILKASPIFGQRESHLSLFHRLTNNPSTHLNSIDQLGSTPLYLACFNGETEMAECLLSKGASTDFETSNKETLLHACVMGNCEQLVLRLISEGMDVDALTLKHICPLYIAVDRKTNPEIMRGLIKKGCKLDVVEKDLKLTPLHAAVLKKYSSAVRMLIDAGCDVNIANKMGNSPLWSACEQNDEELVTALLNSASIDLESGHSPLHITIKNKNAKIMKLLLEARVDLNRLSDDLKSPMLMAVEKESVGMVAMLIKHGADPSAHHALNKFTSGCCFTHKDNHPHMELEPLFIALQNDCIKTATLLVLATHHYPLRELTTLKEILFRTSYIREAKLSEKSIVQFAHFFCRLLSVPRSLKESCRGLVRKALGQYPGDKIAKLSVPDSIKKYIRFTSIDALLPK